MTRPARRGMLRRRVGIRIHVTISRRIIARLLAAILFLGGLTASQVDCARLVDAAQAAADCSGCADEDQDRASDDGACAARVAAAHIAVIAVALLPERSLVRPPLNAALPEAAPTRADPPEPPPPR
jgi:hypothetical protein